MGLEALSCNELLNLTFYNNIYATPFSSHDTTTFHNHHPPPMENTTTYNSAPTTVVQPHGSIENDQKASVEGGGGTKKKRRKKVKVSKNKEKEEIQRMTHIAIERNRRKQMNHHLSELRSLMPESYLKRGDQASIVGGAIEFVKELEYMLQSLEAQKFLLTQKQEDAIIDDHNSNFSTSPTNGCEIPKVPLHFCKVVSYPPNTWSQYPNKYTSKNNATIADIEVNLVQSHANLRIVLRKRLTPLSKMVVFLQKCHLSVLHLNVTTLDPLVLYSISLKVEEGCCLNSADQIAADQIAATVHQILALIEEEAMICLNSK